MAPLSPSELFSLYKEDRLVLHTMPLSTIPERPQRIADKTSLVCASVLFYEGLHLKAIGTHVNNAVARFGEQSKVIETVFGTLHDMDGVWQTHEQLEQQKRPEIRGKPFMYFTNCDMCDVANASGGQPETDYTEAQWQVTPPVKFQRDRDFNFRAHCENAQIKDDKRKHALHMEWNEVRACLNDDNMVGLCYLHDPQHDPRQHIEAAEDLKRRFQRPFRMVVFVLDAPGSKTGELLVTDNDDGSHDQKGRESRVDLAPATEPEHHNSKEGQRLVLFEEYLKRFK